MYRLQDITDLKKIQALLGKEEAEKKTSPWVWVAIIVAAVAVMAAVGYAVYRYFAPDYFEDFEDDFDDEFDDDFFEDEDDSEE